MNDFRQQFKRELKEYRAAKGFDPMSEEDMDQCFDVWNKFSQAWSFGSQPVKIYKEHDIITLKRDVLVPGKVATYIKAGSRGTIVHVYSKPGWAVEFDNKAVVILAEGDFE